MVVLKNLSLIAIFGLFLVGCRPEQMETEYNIAELPQQLEDIKQELDEDIAKKETDPAQEDLNDDDTDDYAKKSDAGDDSDDECSDDFKLVDDYDDFICDPNIKKKIIVGFTADDKADLYYNSEKKADIYGWQKWKEVPLEVSDCGVLAFHAEDVAQVISGLLAIVWEADEHGNKVRKLWSTGENQKIKVAGPNSPTPGNLDWTKVDYNDDTSEWYPAYHCKSHSSWTKVHNERYKIIGDGVSYPNKTWIWYTPNCNTLKQAYFRFKFVFGAEKKVSSCPDND